jgi:Cu-Zn family superoxide dismutase
MMLASLVVGRAWGARRHRQEDRMKQRIPWRMMSTIVVLAAGSLLVTGCAVLFGQHPKHAEAQLNSSAGSTVRGTVAFIESSDGVQVTYNISGLPRNSDHAFRIHERGDCNAVDAGSTGGIFSPAAARLKQGARVEGDLANIHADANGVATGFIIAPDLSLDGIRSVVARSVVIHRDAEDFYAPTDHSPGPALACGVIK